VLWITPCCVPPPDFLNVSTALGREVDQKAEDESGAWTFLI
jgi:hypothetical protein